jgi:putative ABC transport system permease protein
MLTGRQAAVRARDEELLGKLVARLRPSLGLLGLTPEDRKDLERLLGPEKAKPPSPGPASVRVTCPIRGVVRAAADEESRRRGAWALTTADVLVGRSAAERLADRVPWSAEHGHGEVIVEVDDPENVKAVQEALRASGLQAHSAIEYIEREQFTYLVALTAMSVVALIALVVAAIGITNTMLMSVLERVREIGIMKAVGAREGHIQALFLMEGALIGAVGGLLGLLGAWGLSYPADAYLRRLVAERLKVQLDGSLFSFPWWLTAGAPLFAALLTTLAAWWPARRAVRVDPVAALRHE